MKGPYYRMTLVGFAKKNLEPQSTKTWPITLIWLVKNHEKVSVLITSLKIRESLKSDFDLNEKCHAPFSSTCLLIQYKRGEIRLTKYLVVEVDLINYHPLQFQSLLYNHFGIISFKYFQSRIFWCNCYIVTYSAAIQNPSFIL